MSNSEWPFIEYTPEGYLFEEETRRIRRIPSGRSPRYLNRYGNENNFLKKRDKRNSSKSLLILVSIIGLFSLKSSSISQDYKNFFGTVNPYGLTEQTEVYIYHHDNYDCLEEKTRKCILTNELEREIYLDETLEKLNNVLPSHIERDKSKYIIRHAVMKRNGKNCLEELSSHNHFLEKTPTQIQHTYVHESPKGFCQSVSWLEPKPIQFYEVKKGDSIWEIAKKGLNTKGIEPTPNLINEFSQEIMRINGITTNIHPGERIVLP